MNEKVYRFVCDEIGIYEAVDKFCPRDDKRREGKPDGSWFPKVGEKYPGSISFWTEKGLKKYHCSGLRDWHYSVVEGQSKMVIASMPKNILYKDELQVICSPSEVSIVREYNFNYEGPRPSIIPSEDSRPDFIRHHSSLRDWNAYNAYIGSNESFTLISSIGKDLGLKMIGIHHEILRPGKRSSWPHAHQMEEELVFIISGNADIWVNGKLYSTGPGDLVFFEPGTNLAHTVINNSDNDIEMIVLGEQDSKDDLIHYPQHPDRNEECKKGGYYWEDKPVVDFGDHDGNPGKHSHQLKNYPKSVNIKDVEAKVIGGETEPGGINILDKDLGRSLGIKNVAFHHVLIKPGSKSGTPHAESNEEEFVYVLKGNLKAWINGELIPVKEGDSVAFPSGTGITHTLINDSIEDVELIVSGETTKKDNQCIFPLNPEMKDEMGDFWWDDWPEQQGLIKKGKVMSIGINQRNWLTIAHILVAIFFFIISLKFSGAEAYHKTGFTAYSKWLLLGVLLNIGYLIPITKLTRLFQTLTLPLMLIAIIVNVVIYSNPKSLIYYDLLGVALILTSSVLIIKRIFNRG